MLLLGLLSLVVNMPQVKGWNGTVHILADGSVDPPTAPINQNGNIYTLTDNIINSGDGIARALDLVILANRYGQHYP